MAVWEREVRLVMAVSSAAVWEREVGFIVAVSSVAVGLVGEVAGSSSVGAGAGEVGLVEEGLTSLVGLLSSLLSSLLPTPLHPDLSIPVEERTLALKCFRVIYSAILPSSYSAIL